MIRKLIKTRSLHSPRKNTSWKTVPGKSRRKNPEKINPLMKNTFYIILVIFLLLRNKKFNTTKINLKSGLNEKDFLTTVFQSKILPKNRKPDTSSFRSFS